MHMGYLEQMRAIDVTRFRRDFLKRSGAADDGAMRGFRGNGRMNMTTGEDWIDTFFNGGAETIIHYYADTFVFEDVTLFQTIDNQEDLYRAFLPFNNAGPDSPAGVHQFDVIHYDGGRGSDQRGVSRAAIPANYDPELWASLSSEASAGMDPEYDEWAVMNWLWKARHNIDFLGLPAAGKTTHTRGITFHCYKNRRIVREFTHWNFRGVAIQLDALPAQEKFWLKTRAIEDADPC